MIAAASEMYRTAEPSAADVLVGRGKRIQQHPGNIRFRRKIDEFLVQYQSYERGQKQGVVSSVLEWLASSGGHIVKLNREGHWFAVDKEYAMNKVALAFRHRKITLQSMHPWSSLPIPFSHFLSRQNTRQLTISGQQFSPSLLETGLSKPPFWVPIQNVSASFFPSQLSSVGHTHIQPNATSTMASQLFPPIPMAFPQLSQLQPAPNAILSLNNQFPGASLVSPSPHTLTEINNANIGISARENLQFLADSTQTNHEEQSSELVSDEEILQAVQEWEQTASKVLGVVDNNIAKTDVGIDDEDDDDHLQLQLFMEPIDQFPDQQQLQGYE